MKKNLFCIFIMNMLSLMFFTSCGEENISYTASSREFLHDGYVYSINENALLTYRKADGSEENPLCFDPWKIIGVSGGKIALQGYVVKS